MMADDAGELRARFFDPRLTAPGAIPAGAIKITAARHTQLLAGQGAGRTIGIDAKGKPRLITAAPSREAFSRKIKHEAASRIAAIAPGWLQTNDLRSLFVGGATPGAQARFDRIDAVRTASNLIEKQLAATAEKALARFPVADNPLWPRPASTFEGTA